MDVVEEFYLTRKLVLESRCFETKKGVNEIFIRVNISNFFMDYEVRRQSFMNVWLGPSLALGPLNP